MDKTIITKSEEETKEIARKFAGKLKPGEIVCLYGDLGLGKTTFTKGIAEGLGIKERIISPTFTIIREHQIKSQKSPAKQDPASREKVKSASKNSKVTKMFHIDLYRIEKREQLIELGISEILDDRSSVKIIEWAEKAHDLLPKKRWEVRFELAEKENERVINIYEQ